MKKLFLLAVLLVFAISLSHSEEIEKSAWKEFLDYYLSLSNEPSENETWLLYEHLQRVATENISKPVNETEAFMKGDLYSLLGLPTMVDKKGNPLLRCTISEPIAPDHVVVRNPLKSFLLRGLIVRLACEYPEDKLDPFIRLATVCSLAGREVVPYTKDENPFHGRGKAILLGMINQLNEKWRFFDQFRGMIAEDAAQLQIEGATLLERVRGWRKHTETLSISSLREILATYSWLSSNITPEELLADELPDPIPVDAEKHLKGLVESVAKAEIFSDTNFLLLEREEGRRPPSLADQLLMYFISTVCWKKVLNGSDVPALRRELTWKLVLFEPCRKFPHIMRILDPEAGQRNKALLDSRNSDPYYLGSDLKWQDWSYELISKTSGEGGPAWFYSDFRLPDLKGIAEITSDFVYPLCTFVTNKSMVSQQNHGAVMNRYPFVFPRLLSETGLVYWNPAYYLLSEFSPSHLFSMNSSVPYNYSEGYLTSLLETEKDRLFEGVSGVSRNSVNPRTALQIFKPCLMHHYEKTSYEIFTLSPRIFARSAVPYEYSMALIVVSPLKDSKPTETKPYLTKASDSSWVWKTGIVLRNLRPWNVSECFESERGKEIAGIAAEIVDELSITSEERFKRAARARKEWEYGSFGKPVPPDKPEVPSQSLAEIRKRREASIDKLTRLLCSLADKPDEIEYRKATGNLQQCFEIGNACTSRQVMSISRSISQSFEEQMLSNALGISSIPYAAKLDMVGLGMMGFSRPGVSGRMYTMYGAILGNLLTEREKYGTTDKKKFDDLTSFAAAFSRLPCTFEGDKHDPVHSASYTWLENKIAELDREFKLSADYHALVEAEFRNLNIQGNSLAEKISELRERFKNCQTAQMMSALIKWSFENIPDSALIKNDLPEFIPAEDLTSVADIVNKYGGLDKLGSSTMESIREAQAIQCDFCDYLLVARSLFLLNERIENGEGLQLRRKCISGGHFLYFSPNYVTLQLCSSGALPEKFAQYVLMKRRSWKQEMNEDDRRTYARYELVEIIENGGAWFAAREEPQGVSGSWSPSEVHLYPFSVYLGRTVNLKPRYALPLVADSFYPLFDITHESGWVAKKKNHFGSWDENTSFLHSTPTDGMVVDFDVSLAALRVSLEKGTLSEEFPGLEQREVMEALNRAKKSKIEEDESLLADLRPCTWFYMPRTRLSIWRFYEPSYGDETKKIPLGSYVVSVSPFPGDTPLDYKTSYSLTNGQTELWKMGFASKTNLRNVNGKPVQVELPYPFNLTRFFTSQGFSELFSPFEERMKQEFEEYKPYILDKMKWRIERNKLLWGDGNRSPFGKITR